MKIHKKYSLIFLNFYVIIAKQEYDPRKAGFARLERGYLDSELFKLIPTRWQSHLGGTHSRLAKLKTELCFGFIESSGVLRRFSRAKREGCRACPSVLPNILLDVFGFLCYNSQ